MTAVTRDDIKAQLGAGYSPLYLDGRITETNYGFVFDLSPDDYYAHGQDLDYLPIPPPGWVEVAKDSRQYIRFDGDMGEAEGFEAALAAEGLSEIATEDQLIRIAARMGKKPEYLPRSKGGRNE